MLQRMRQGDEAAWLEFQNFYKGLILFLGGKCGLTHQECDALVQDVMVSIHREHVLENYDHNKCRFRSYLRTIVKRKAALIKEARAPRWSNVSENMPDESQLEQQFEAEWKQAIYKSAMQKLRETVDSKKFMAFELHEIQGMPRDEVAKVMGISEAAVSLSSTRLKKRLEEIVERLKVEFD